MNDGRIEHPRHRTETLPLRTARLKAFPAVLAQGHAPGSFRLAILVTGIEVKSSVLQFDHRGLVGIQAIVIAIVHCPEFPGLAMIVADHGMGS